jgi:hypothetical protein
MTNRTQQLAAHQAAERIDLKRDRDFHQPASRFVTSEELEDLADVLCGTDDSIEVGLSQIGIDPDLFDEDDIKAIQRELKRLGLAKRRSS